MHMPDMGTCSMCNKGTKEHLQGWHITKESTKAVVLLLGTCIRNI